MTEEPMTREEIDNIIFDDPVKTDLAYLGGPICNPDYIRDNAMRHAIESMRGMEPHHNRMVEVLYRAEAIYKFLTEKSS